MNLRIASVREATPEEWDGAWRNCRYATYFHGRAWSEAWSEYTHGRLYPAPQRIEFSDGVPVLMPLTRERRFRGLVRRTLSSPAGTYGGWLADSTFGDAHARLLVEWMLERCPDLIWRWNPYASMPQQMPGEWLSDQTYALDLTSGFGEVVQKWQKGSYSSVGRAVRKALRNGIVVRRANEEGDWRAYYDIYRDSLRRWGESATNRYELSLFDALQRHAAGTASVQLWLALKDGRIVAGSVCFYSRQVAVYWHGAALDAYFESRPVNLLLHEVIRDACDRGVDWFDFNPSGGHAGVEAFKRSFGAEAKQAPLLRTHSPSALALSALDGRIRTWKHAVVGDRFDDRGR